MLEVIHRYKYNRAFWFEPFLFDLFVSHAAPELRSADWDWIVPVPLHPLKQREREFNQAEHLAAPLSDATGIPLNKKLLRRVQATRTQTRLSREERQENVKKAFSLREGNILKDRRIVLVDDVFTTGATTNACARTLREAGATAVCVWTVARGI
jgi:ComF family protein